MKVKMTVNLDMDELAKIIQSLSDEELELLEMKLNGEWDEIKDRVDEIKEGRVILLSEKEVFKNV
ncbi:MAG: hypothetical protein IEMM0008_1480 [bacterium]|nr:MAG: hypothetical protein IEMM0008_1480 [bacterium]